MLQWLGLDDGVECVQHVAKVDEKGAEDWPLRAVELLAHEAD